MLANNLRFNAVPAQTNSYRRLITIEESARNDVAATLFPVVRNFHLAFQTML
jgi:hypothetical protein